MKSIQTQFEDIIKHFTIEHWEVEPESSRFKAEIEFVDNTMLTVKDFIFQTGRKYAYHWQDSDGKLIARWDNAPHWKKIDTFPHHRHEGGAVFPSEEMHLEEVMKEISRRMKITKNQHN